jgi:EmrB/QacA subfamily drug resistance transporter
MTSRRLSLTVAGLLLTLLLAALDATIVATAMPRIVDEMHALDRYTWITTVYLLTSTLAVPVVGKLADQYGRKVFLVGGTLLFVLSSLLCGLAASWWELVGARALQGVGAGVVTASVFAAVPSLFSASARARVIGLFTGTYGLASIVGPLLGGVVTDAVGWRGVFVVNLPLGLLALALLLTTYPNSRPRLSGRPVVDSLGAATLVAGMTPILLVLSLGGHDLAWASPVTAGLLLLSLVALAVFVRVERRAAEPIIPLGLLGSRGVGVAALGMALMAAGLFATSLFTPLFVQGVAGQSSTSGGAILAPMMLAWVLASVVVGQLIARVGRTRYTAVGGMAVAAFGLWLMASLSVEASYALIARDLLVIGLGLGTALSSFAIAAQNAVALEQTGVATALGTFARSIGTTVASAGLGGLLAASLGTSSAASVAPTVLAGALHTTFLAAMAIVGVGAVAALALRERPFPAAAAARLTGDRGSTRIGAQIVT